MASCITSQWANTTSPQAKLTVNISSSTATTATLSWTLEYIASSPAESSARSWEVYIAGTKVDSGSYAIDGKTGTYTVATGTKKITKTTSTQSIAFKVSFAFNLTWSGVYCGTKTASGTISVGPKTSYTIAYNANGGSGAPSSQKKWHGTNLTLSSTKPTRTGYAFQGWALTDAAADAGTWYYQAGGTCAKNENLTLYAVWKANTYTVTYNTNGGSGAPSKQTKTYGVTLTLSSTKPTRTNYTFKGWGTSASTTTVSYSAGDKYSKNANITLYAIWELSYSLPRIPSMSVARCADTAGTLQPDGTYALVEFEYECDATVSSIVIEWKLTTDTTYSNTTGPLTPSTSTSASVSTVIGNGLLDTESSYHIRVTVTDTGGSYSRQRTLTSTVYAIDVMPENAGIAFGKTAEKSGYADFQYSVLFEKGATLGNNMALRGLTTDDATVSLAYVSTSNNSMYGYGSFNSSLGTAYYYGNNVRIRGVVDVKAYDNDNKLYCDVVGNKVLWTGEYYMNSSQSCTLSESVKAQANGIVLVWSWYSTSSSEAQNQNFHHFFVPKQHVIAHPGTGKTMFLTNTGAGTVAAKYVYINDTTITGYSNNNAESAVKDSGLTTTPKNFVLRYVIGV